MRARRALLLDGRRDDSPTLAVAHDALRDLLSAAGWTVDDWALRDEDISFCTGCFGCWVKTPGVCASRGAARTVAERFIASDLVILLTPITFGGYSAELKKALEHAIPVLLPFFRKVGGDTHHTMRYDTQPDWVAVGVVEADVADATNQEETFRDLVARNAFNFMPRMSAVAVLSSEASESELRTSVGELLARVNVAGAPADPVVKPTIDRHAFADCSSSLGGAGVMTPKRDTPRTALVLIGSPKPARSTSLSLGKHLLGRLAERGLNAEIVSLSTALRSAEATDALCTSVDNADFVVLSFPLYVDSLPAVCTRALEVIARHREATGANRQGVAAPAFVAICQSGFPEQGQSEVALRICHNFAVAAGFEWAGALAMGGGGMIDGRPLAKLGGQVRNQVRALELTAEALCDGRKVPDEAVRLMGKLPIPAFVYRKMGHLGWRKQAKEAGARSQLAARPFAGQREPWPS
jgi:multimeric flavodoxin WrbA